MHLMTNLQFSVTVLLPVTVHNYCFLVVSLSFLIGNGIRKRINS